MKKVIIEIALVIVLIASVFLLSGCTLQIETTDNSVSASVDGDTTQKVDNIIDWIKVRLQKLFKTEGESSANQDNSQTVQKA